ncbi:hypothetical protein KFE25_005869 [Diacronema lutheri]|uniref:Phosphodiesterase n=1 Tax=Diacronema lutheri TaxID=2081491 RepID=A0A8J5Y136_DIALT|nr:hypothetical protein KFE25_005869 [Diacronema lutheri]
MASSGVLSIRLEELSDLPLNPVAHPDGSAVQVVATLLQGSRRDQRTSAPLAYASTASWAEDEVLEFGGVLRGARLFLDAYAHHGVQLPVAGDEDAVEALPLRGSSLLGKVAVCVDELPSDMQLSATRPLLVGRLRFRLAYACAHGSVGEPVGVHAPAVRVRLSAPDDAHDSLGAEAVPPLPLHSLRAGQRRRPSLNGRPLAQLGRAPSIVVSEAEDDDELELLLAQLAGETHPADDDANEAAGGANASETDAHATLAAMSGPDAARVLRQHRVLSLLGARSLASPTSLLLQLARKHTSPAPRGHAAAPAGSAAASSDGASKPPSGRPSPRRHSWAASKYLVNVEGTLPMRASDSALDRVRASADARTDGVQANRLFDDSEFSDFVSDYTRDVHLERIESPGRNRRHALVSARKFSSRPQSSCRSHSGNASPLSFATAAERNRDAAARTDALRHSHVPRGAPLGDGSDADDEPPMPQIDAIATRAVPVSAQVPLGPSDPQVRALLAAFAPSADGRPAPRMLDWSFDIFEVEAILGPATLPFLVVSYVRTLPLLAELDVDPLCFARYLSDLAVAYRPLPYHSVTHGADAFHALVNLLERGLCPPARDGSDSESASDGDGDGGACSRRGSRTSRASFAPQCGSGPDLWELTPAEMLGMLVGMAAHDVDHTGQNNAFHIATGSELAITYNDVSVLENHHCAFAFRTLAHPERNFADVLRPAEYKEFRETMIAVILGTDMAKHFEHVAHLLSTIEGGSALNLSGSVTDRRFLMQTAAHAADISNACRQTALAVRWSERVTVEFYAQGDEEKRRGMAVTKFFDRQHVQLAKSQLGFFDFIVTPLFEPLSKLIPCADLLTQLHANRAYWAARLEEDETTTDRHSAHAEGGAPDDGAGGGAESRALSGADESASAVAPAGTSGSPPHAPSADCADGTPALPTLTSLAAAVGFVPAAAEAERYGEDEWLAAREAEDRLAPSGMRAHADSLKLRDRRPSVASIPEMAEVDAFDDEAEQQLCAQPSPRASPSAPRFAGTRTPTLRTSPARWPAEPTPTLDCTLGAPLGMPSVDTSSADNGAGARGAGTPERAPRTLEAEELAQPMSDSATEGCARSADDEPRPPPPRAAESGEALAHPMDSSEEGEEGEEEGEGDGAHAARSRALVPESLDSRAGGGDPAAEHAAHDDGAL